MYITIKYLLLRCFQYFTRIQKISYSDINSGHKLCPDIVRLCKIQFKSLTPIATAKSKPTKLKKTIEL